MLGLSPPAQPKRLPMASEAFVVGGAAVQFGIELGVLDPLPSEDMPPPGQHGPALQESSEQSFGIGKAVPGTEGMIALLSEEVQQDGGPTPAKEFAGEVLDDQVDIVFGDIKHIGIIVKRSRRVGADVVDECPGFVVAAVPPQPGAEGKVDIVEIHPEGFIEGTDIVEEMGTYGECGTAGAEDLAGLVIVFVVAAVVAALVDVARGEHPIAG